VSKVVPQLDGLPPWRARSERERRRMVTFVLDQLDQMDIDDSRSIDPDYERVGLELAERGDVTLLRLANPRIARFIHPLALKRGQRRRKRRSADRHTDRVDAAAMDVPRIRDIWRRAYDGVRYRTMGCGPTAAEIAAERWSVKVDDVERRVKKLPFKR
jgi:hypothetical protein